MKPKQTAVEIFDRAPDAMLVDLTSACTILGRSRSSLYRHFQAGDLKLVKVGHSTRVRVGDLRRLAQA